MVLFCLGTIFTGVHCHSKEWYMCWSSWVASGHPQHFWKVRQWSSVCVCHFWVWQWVFACNENQMVGVASEWDHPNNGGALQCVCCVFTDCRTYSDAEIQQTVQEIALCAVQGVCSPVRAHRIACHSIVWCWVCVVPQDRQGDSTNSTGTFVKIETVLRGIISYLIRSLS